VPGMTASDPETPPVARHADDAAPPADSVDRRWFDDKYAHDPDPWKFAQRWYERRRYEVVLAALPQEKYVNAFEPGCSIGELTYRLATRCKRLLAVDFSPAAVSRARRRVQMFKHVEVRLATLPEQWPDDSFDLVVLAELLYYLSATDLTRLLDRLAKCLQPGGHVVAVHCWQAGQEHGYDGFNVHAQLGRRAELETVVHHCEEQFILDVLRRRVEPVGEVTNRSGYPSR
jgi:SAM-dependent methyltransferase